MRRERDERDRRRTLVAPTDRGLRLASETDGTPDPGELLVALETISPAEREALLGALRTLSEDAHRL